MVMDLALMRAERFREQTVDFVLSPDRPALVFPDQDALNLVFAGRWTGLDPAWNCLTVILLPYILGATWSEDAQHGVLALERAARSPAIVHFEGPPTFKPWHRRCINPYAGLYRQYRATTPWPLTTLEGRARDVALARLPGRVQARLWQLRARYVGRR
jgi:lipopolysaccharide biosynthesis glycosyltransferase